MFQSLQLVTFMENILIYSEFLKQEDFRLNLIFYSQVIMLIEVNKIQKSFAYYLPIKLNTQKTFSFLEETTSVDQLIEYTAFMTSVNADIIYAYGKNSFNALIVFQQQLLSMIEFFVFMEAYLLNYLIFNKLIRFLGLLMYQTRVYFVIFYGVTQLILKRMLQIGVKMIEEFLILLEKLL